MIILNSFIPAVEKGIREIVPEGVLAGYPTVDFRAVLYDDSYHNAMPEAGHVLLEPVYRIVVTVPEEFMGDILGDLNTRRVQVQGMEQTCGNGIVTAEVTLAEIQRYATDLSSMTQGRGIYTIFLCFHAARRSRSCLCRESALLAIGSLLVKLVALGGHDQIGQMKVVYLVGPPDDGRAAPLGDDRWMVALLFGGLAHLDGKIQGCPKVVKVVLSAQLARAVFGDDLPLWYLGFQRLELLIGDRRCTLLAGPAGLFTQFQHASSPLFVLQYSV